MTIPVSVKGIAIGAGIPKICVPLVGRTREELLSQCRLAADAKADLAEWRADFYEGLYEPGKLLETLEDIVRNLGQIPLLFTIRTQEEGGNARISAEDYVNINQTVSKTGMADLIDVEYFQDLARMKAMIPVLQSQGSYVIVSSHNFQKTEETEALRKRLEELEGSGGDIVKLAVMPEGYEDVSRFLQVIRTFSRETRKPVIAMSMGVDGAVSRILGELTGSAVTFGTAGEASAPGQIPSGPLRELLTLIHENFI